MATHCGFRVLLVHLCTDCYDIGEKCMPIPIGIFAEPERRVCSTCVAGRYAARGSMECRACAVGKSVAMGKGTQADDCGECPAGQYLTGTVCRACAAGRYAASGAMECRDCAAGKSAIAGKGVCTDCPAGKYDFKGAPAAVHPPACSVCPTLRSHIPLPPLATPLHVP